MAVILVKFNSNLTPEEATAIALRGEAGLTYRAGVSPNTYSFEIREGRGITAAGAIEKLKALPEVVYADIAGTAKPSMFPGSVPPPFLDKPTINPNQVTPASPQDDMTVKHIVLFSAGLLVGYLIARR